MESIGTRIGRIIDRVPEGHYVMGGTGIYNTPLVEIQAHNQEQARAVRMALGAKEWEKQVNENLGWWEYHTTIEEIPVRVYGCEEGPASCKLIEEEVVVTEQVPVAFEERQVTKIVKRWECPQ